MDLLQRPTAPECFCDILTLISRRYGMKPTRERGRPARTTLAKPRPSPRPGSTGKDPRALLRPGPCGSRRQGGRVRHRRETERQPKGEDAGGTPALPGGPPSSRLPFKGESAQPIWLDGRLKSRFDIHLVALRESSCLFVDNSFFWLFQTRELSTGCRRRRAAAVIPSSHGSWGCAP